MVVLSFVYKDKKADHVRIVNLYEIVIWYQTQLRTQLQICFFKPSLASWLFRKEAATW